MCVLLYGGVEGRFCIGLERESLLWLELVGESILGGGTSC